MTDTEAASSSRTAEPAPPAPEGTGAASPEPADTDAGAGNAMPRADDGYPPEPDAAHEATDQAANQAGGASNHREHVRAAQQTYGGDSISGSKFVFHLAGGEQTAPLRRLSPTLEEFARHAFVPPDNWDKYRIDFGHHRTVLLAGAPGHGRDTMAIRLLQTVEATTIYRLDPRVDLGRMAERLSTEQIERGTAFLLCEPTEISSLDSYTFQSLEAALTDADARLVVTVGTDVALSDNQLLRYRMGLPAAPKLRDVLRRHLGYLLDELRADYILTNADVEVVIAEKLDSGEATCELTAFLARLLSQASDPVDPTQLRNHLRRHTADEFDIWFEGLHDLELRCFAIALAVLNGLPYEDVSDAARRLHQRLASGGSVVLTDNGQLAVKGTEPFQLERSWLRRRLQATTSQTSSGTTEIKFRDGEYPKQIIDRVWHGHQIQDKLLAWLGELVGYPSARVRAYAGTTLGLLSTFSFDHVCARVFQPWAGNSSLYKKEAVADALRIAAEEPALRSAVRSTVDKWYANRRDVQRQATAALALGTSLGAGDATEAIAALVRLAMVDNVVTRVFIGRGFAWLVADDAAALAPQMYAAVQRCLLDPRRAVAGQWIFLLVANDLVTELPTALGGVTRWPTLLHLAKLHERLRAPLFELWALVLTQGQAVDLAQVVMRNWAALAEVDDDLRESFTRMVRAIALIDGRSGAALARLARQWDSDEELLPMPNIALAVGRVVTI